MTEWEEIVDAEWAGIAGIMGMPRYVFDGRNAPDAESMADLGFDYAGVGRGYPDRLAKGEGRSRASIRNLFPDCETGDGWQSMQEPIDSSSAIARVNPYPKVCLTH